MQKSILALVLVCAAQTSACAQSTWNGLTFGSSVAEVRQLLAKQDLKVERSDAPWIVKPGWDFKPSGIKVTLHFIPRLYFSDADRLEKIILGFQRGENGVVNYAAVTSTYEQLINKYGKPATESGSCTSVVVTDFVNNPQTMECKAMWKAQGQTVALNWLYRGEEVGQGELLFLGITYVPLQAEAF